MAVIDNLKVSVKSFSRSTFYKCIGLYGTSDILNFGETYDTDTGDLELLTCTFTISGLNGHTIESITIRSVLLDSSGALSDSNKFSIGITDFGSTYKGTLDASADQEKIIATIIKSQLSVESDIDVALNVKSEQKKSCYYCLHSIIINLLDIDYSIKVLFSGPNSNRKPSVITCSPIVVSNSNPDVTFTKDPSTNFDSNNDNLEGRVYFRRDGIYVDNYQFGTVAPATSSKKGIVTTKSDLDTDSSGIAVIIDENGVAAAPKFVVNVLNKLNDLVDNGTVVPADDETYGAVKLSKDSFDVEASTGDIIVPTDAGVAATPLLVVDALIKAKKYTDDHALQEINIETSETETVTDNEGNSTELYKNKSLRTGYTFSLHFEEKNNKIYISWLNM